MKLRTLGTKDLRGKRVLVRIDGNVPVKNGKVVDGLHGKIARTAVDLEWLRQHGARIIMLTHLGSPEGRRVTAYSVRPIAKRLSELLGVKVGLSRQVVGPEVERMVARMQDGDLLLLENVRFDPREEQNSPSLARAWAKLADIYVNDAFAVSHRAHASLDAIASELPSYAGPLLANEVAVLSKLMRHPKHPFVLAMGGLKMQDKISVLERLLPEAERILIGGALATCFLKADGWEVGASVYDTEGVALAKKILKKARAKLLLPVDVCVTKGLRKGGKARVVGLSDVSSTDAIVDIGPLSMQMFLRELQTAKTIIWNGPFGYVEVPVFAAATHLLARSIAGRTGKAVTVVGGGDTLPMIESTGLADRFTLVSTGGGAMLEFLGGKKLPGIEVLEM